MRKMTSRLAISEGVNTFGSMLSKLMFVFILSVVNHNVTSVGLLSIVLILPSIVLGPFIGNFIDHRENLLRIMISVNVISAIMMFCLSGYIYIYGSNAKYITEVILLTALFSSLFSCMYNPTATKFIKMSVSNEQYVNVTSKLTSYTTLGGMIASLGSSFMMVKNMEYLGILLDGFSFVISLFFLSNLHNPSNKTEGEIQNDALNLKEGIINSISDIKQPIILGVFITSFCYNFLLAPFQVYSSSVANIAHLPSLVGILQTVYTLGMLSGSLIYSKIYGHLGTIRMLNIALFGVPLAFFLLGNLYYIGFFILGMMIPTYNITTKNIFMEVIPDYRFATFMTVYGSFLGIVQPISLFVIPAVIDNSSFYTFLKYAVVIYFVIALVSSYRFKTSFKE